MTEGFCVPKLGEFKDSNFALIIDDKVDTKSSESIRPINVGDVDDLTGAEEMEFLVSIWRC